MNFHQTKYGQRFFDHQLPKLTNALETIAAALEKKQAPAQLTAEVPSFFWWMYIMAVWNRMRYSPTSQKQSRWIVLWKQPMPH